MCRKKRNRNKIVQGDVASDQCTSQCRRGQLYTCRIRLAKMLGWHTHNTSVRCTHECYKDIQALHRTHAFNRFMACGKNKNDMKNDLMQNMCDKVRQVGYPKLKAPNREQYQGN